MNANARVSPAIAVLLLNGCSATGTAGAPDVAGALDKGKFQVAASQRSVRIYVANVGNSTITTYRSDGSETTPTIQTGAPYLYGVAVGPTGKIYALSFDSLHGSGTSGVVTSYTRNGKPTKPTITIPEQGFSAPICLTVNGEGKIYVLSQVPYGSPGIVTTYTRDGKSTQPTFSTGPDATSIAVDQNGKIYVTNGKGPSGKFSVTTYNSDGTPAEPTITRGLHQPVGVAVAADGTIYVANLTNGGPDGTGATYLTSYRAGGQGPLQRTKARAGSAGGIAVDSTGKIYLPTSTAYSNVLRTYDPQLTRITPTIRAGLFEPSGIALH